MTRNIEKASKFTRAEAARINGARSCGPDAPRGKPVPPGAESKDWRLQPALEKNFTFKKLHSSEKQAVPAQVVSIDSHPSRGKKTNPTHNFANKSYGIQQVTAENAPHFPEAA